MLPSPFQNALVLTGPTGSGKTALGIELAQTLNAEVVSMDSMALYRGMDIGTAKPTLAERAMAPHHLIDVREPWESASVAWWLEQAKCATQEIETRGKQALFVGGTPLYLKALLSGLFDGPPGDEQLRKRLIEVAQQHGSTHLHERLAAIDPLSAERIHPNDVRRMVRALEVYELTGKPMSAWQTQWKQEPASNQQTENAVLCLELPRADLYARIDRRVEWMFMNGLIDEVRRLRSLERPLSLEAGQAVGYQEVSDLLDGKCTYAEAVSRVQTRSRNYAKRQFTWFRHLPGLRFVTPERTRALWQPKMCK
jgi:tRNA dimethylallyltransferase